MIIAFGNKARHGKDTCAQAVVDYYNRKSETFQLHGIGKRVPVKHINFGDVLKKEVNDAIEAAGSAQALFNQGPQLGGPHFPDWVLMEEKPDMSDPKCPLGKYGKLLQWWGTEYRRTQDPDYWVKKWWESVKGYKGIVIASDLRFENEANAIQQASGHTVNVYRMNQDGSKYTDPTRDSNHRSEIELDNYNWDFYLTARTGQSALLGEQAVTLAEYLLALEKI